MSLCSPAKPSYIEWVNSSRANGAQRLFTSNTPFGLRRSGLVASWASLTCIYVLGSRKTVTHDCRSMWSCYDPKRAFTGKMSVIAKGFHGYPYPATRIPSNGNDLRRSHLLLFPYTRLCRGELASLSIVEMTLFAHGHS